MSDDWGFESRGAGVGADHDAEPFPPRSWIVVAVVGALALLALGFVAGRATAPEGDGTVASGDEDPEEGADEDAEADDASPTSSTPSTTVPADPGGSLTAEDQVQLDGVGPVKVGMTLPEASEAAGVEIVGQADSSPGGLDSGCYFAAPATGPPGLSFMVIDDLIARVDVSSPGVNTLSGVGVGSTSDEVVATYGAERIAVEPHPFRAPDAGQYLRYVPSAESELSLIFETDGATVTSYRAGDAEAVAFTEGCA